jgi:proteasome lid subunit RPN8/RPN11
MTSTNFPGVVTIAEQVMADMHAHAVGTYPNECCGLVIGHADGAQTVRRIRNIQDEMHAQDPERYPRTARTAYAGHPGDLRDALGTAESTGNQLAAFYHSHPDHDAYFSDEDVAQATPFGEPSYPDALQIVVSVYEGVVRSVKAFRWSGETETFDPTDI